MREFVRLLRLLRPYRRRLAAAIACMLLYSAAFTASLTLVDPFTRLMFGSSPPPAAGLAAGGAPAGWLDRLPAAWHHWLFEADRLVAFERLCGVILALFLLKNAADYVASYLSVSVEQAAMRDLRRALFAHLSRLSLDFYHGRRAGTLISRLTNDVEALRSTLAVSISNLLKDGLTLLGSLVIVFVASWKLALFAMVVVPPAALALVAIGRNMRRRSNRAQEKMADLTSVLQESIAGVRVVQAFGMERYEAGRQSRK